MAKWLKTTGSQVLSIAICDRCHFKKKYVDLMPDPNFPGIRVCNDCVDVLDPWRLNARQTEVISLPNARPDLSVAIYPTVGEVL